MFLLTSRLPAIVEVAVDEVETKALAVEVAEEPRAPDRVKAPLRVVSPETVRVPPTVALPDKVAVEVTARVDDKVAAPWTAKDDWRSVTPETVKGAEMVVVPFKVMILALVPPKVKSLADREEKEP